MYGVAVSVYWEQAGLLISKVNHTWQVHQGCTSKTNSDRVQHRKR